jgi:hypothetical protein
VRNGTERLPFPCYDKCVPNKKRKKELANATHTSVKKEMAKPRMARSARITALNLDTTRIPEQPSATTSGTVKQIISSRDPTLTEKAQIAVDGADYPYRDFRIENSLTDEHGDDVMLKKGDHVEVTVTSEPKTPTAATNKDSLPTRRKKAENPRRQGRKRIPSGGFGSA